MPGIVEAAADRLGASCPARRIIGWRRPAPRLLSARWVAGPSMPIPSRGWQACAASVPCTMPRSFVSMNFWCGWRGARLTAGAHSSGSPVPSSTISPTRLPRTPWSTWWPRRTSFGVRVGSPPGRASSQSSRSRRSWGVILAPPDDANRCGGLGPASRSVRTRSGRGVGMGGTGHRAPYRGGSRTDRPPASDLRCHRAQRCAAGCTRRRAGLEPKRDLQGPVRRET